MYYYIEGSEDARNDSEIEMLDKDEASEININLPDEEEINPDSEVADVAPEPESAEDSSEDSSEDDADDTNESYSSKSTLDRIYESLSDVSHVKAIRKENVVKAVIPKKRSSVVISYDESRSTYVVESRVKSEVFTNEISETMMIRCEDDLVKSIILGGN